MTTAIGIVITDHIVAGRLEDQRLTGKPLRFPADPAELDALSALPPSELVEMLASQIAFLAKRRQQPSQTPSASPFPASSATASSRTRPI